MSGSSNELWGITSTELTSLPLLSLHGTIKTSEEHVTHHTRQSNQTAPVFTIFSNLPAELRLKIWRYVILDSSGIGKMQIFWSSDMAMFPSLPLLCYACRESYEETRILLKVDLSLTRTFRV
jgi:hypothetical protein